MQISSHIKLLIGVKKLERSQTTETKILNFYS